MSGMQKDPNAQLDYQFDWRPYLTNAGDKIVSVQIVAAGCEIEEQSFSDYDVTVWIKGGVIRADASITCQITTASIPPRIDERTMKIKIKDL